MVEEIVEEVLENWTLTLEYILTELEVTDHEVLQALLDGGVISKNDLYSLISADDEEED